MVVAGLAFCALAWGASEGFATDPGWIGERNREEPQAFGYSKSNHCGRGAGEIGGAIYTEADPAQPAYYATPVGPFRSLDYPISFSFDYRKVAGDSGRFYIGFFDPPTLRSRFNFLALEFENGDAMNLRFAGRLHSVREPVTHMDKVGAPMPVRVGDGAVHRLALDYDPDEGPNGQIRVVVDRSERFLCHLSAEQRDALVNYTHFGVFCSLYSGFEPEVFERLGPLTFFADDFQFTAAPGAFTESNAVADLLKDDDLERPIVASSKMLAPGYHSLADPMLVAVRRGVRLGKAPTGEPVGWQPPKDVVGKLKTPYLIFPTGVGSRLLLDAEIDGGEVLVQFLDARRKPIPGFSFIDCVPLTDSGNAQTVHIWEAAGEPHIMQPRPMDLAHLNHASVAIEFRLRNARLRGFTIQSGDEIPMPLANGPHLFIDDYLTRETRGVKWVMQAPMRLPLSATDDESAPKDPRLVKAVEAYNRIPETLATLDAEELYPAVGSTFYDSERNVFRRWGVQGDPEGEKRCAIMYSESDDLHTGWGARRRIWAYDGLAWVFFDEGPNAPNPDRRFKFLYYVHEPPPNGLYVAFSPDGFEWHIYEGNPVLPVYSHNGPCWSLGVGDVTSPYWDPIRQQYGAFLRAFCKSDMEFGVQSYTTRPGIGVRLDDHSVSKDFVHWERPERAMCPDPLDAAPGFVTEFHGETVIARGDLLLAFVNKVSGEQADYCPTELAVSRDGRHWQRFRDPFLAPNPDPDSNEHGLTWLGTWDHWEVGDYVFFSYWGHKSGFKSPKGWEGGSGGWVAVYGDRYVARTGEGREPGTLITHLIKYTGRNRLELTVNADAAQGELRAQLTNAAGNAIAGFAFEQCEPVRKDGLAIPIQWQRDMDELRGESFHIEFRLQDTRLFGFSLGRESDE